MSISNALSSALTSLNVTQQNLSVLSNNIANANTDGYAKRTVVQSSQTIAGVGQGVIIEGIERQVDQLLLEQMRTQSSSLGLAEIQEEYFEQIQVLYGQPNNGNSLSDVVDGFFESLNLLASTPESTSLKLDAVNQAEQLTDLLTGISQGLHELRLQADQDLKTLTNNINSDIDRIFTLNLAISDAISRAQATADLEEQRDIVLESLAEKIDIKIIEGDSAADISVITSGGVSLLDSSNRYELSYDNAGGLSVFTDGLDLNPVTLTAINVDGSTAGSAVEIVSSGASSTIVNTIEGGQFKGLTDLRDSTIPGFIDQLDAIAEAIRDQMNAIHNKGLGYPARNSITGTTLVSAEDARDFSGQIQIGLVDNQGQPIDSPYSSEDAYGMRPLTLDLSTLDSNLGAGTPTMQTIIDEINYYFGEPQPRASIGNLEDIKIVTTQDTINSAGTINFDLELDSLSAFDSGVTIQNMTVTDSLSAAQTVTTPAAFPMSEFTHTAGERSRTGDDPNFAFTGTGNLPYTVTLEVQVDDGQGNVDSISTGTITYLIDASPSTANVRNTRHNPTVVTGDAELITPTVAEERIVAELVDADGNVITDGTTQGYLRLTAGNSELGIVIDELDSQESGLSTDTSITATNRGFSHYFGLNNLFDEYDTTSGSALNLSIREDILSTPNNLSLGGYSQAVSTGVTGIENYTYSISIGDNSIIKQLAELKDTLTTFSATGGIPLTTTSISDYATTILSYVSSQKSFADADVEQQRLLMEQMEAAFASGSGVNIDEELANTIVFQRTYSASSRIITVVDELLETLINSV